MVTFHGSKNIILSVLATLLKHNLESICSYSVGLFDIVWYSLLPHLCDKSFFA